MSLEKIGKKVKDASLLWDQYPLKLLIWVYGASGLHATKKTSFRVFCGRQRYKSKPNKSGPTSPIFDEVCFFVPNSEDEVSIELWDEHMFGNVFLGRVSIGKVNLLTREKIHCVDENLSGETKKRKAKIGGNISFRYYLSELTETRPQTGHPQGYDFNYQALYPSFQTGDLLLYDAPGVFSSLTKLSTALPYSRVGMIVRLPNKYTEETETYVLEVTRNLDGFFDAFAETGNRKGLNLFRCQERIHHFYGAEIWYAKLKVALDVDTETKLLRHVWDHHGQEYTVPTTKGRVVDVVNECFPALRTSQQTVDLSDAKYVYEALQQCGAAQTQEGNSCILDLLDLSLWQPPVSIKRVHVDAQSVVELPFTPLTPKDSWSNKMLTNPQERFASKASLRLRLLKEKNDVLERTRQIQQLNMEAEDDLDEQDFDKDVKTPTPTQDVIPSSEGPDAKDGDLKSDVFYMESEPSSTRSVLTGPYHQTQLTYTGVGTISCAQQISEAPSNPELSSHPPQATGAV